MNLSLVLLYIHLGLIPDLCFIANILLMNPLLQKFILPVSSPHSSWCSPQEICRSGSWHRDCCHPDSHDDDDHDDHDDDES